MSLLRVQGDGGEQSVLRSRSQSERKFNNTSIERCAEPQLQTTADNAASHQASTIRNHSWRP